MSTATAQSDETLADGVEVPSLSVLDIQTRGEIDVQIATAKRYPRSIKQFKQTAMEMATLDEDTAAACIYAVPRDGKTIEGPSARLAEIIVSAWGNSRAGARTISDDGNFVIAQGAFHDLERNVAINFEVRRRIVNKYGKRYSDDMIGTTANAACSIALRNAVLKGIPKAFWQSIYEAAKKTAIGDAQTLANRRAAMLEYFQKMGVTRDKLFALLQVKGLDDITLDHMATLKGLATAIRDGETTVDDAFATAETDAGKPPTRPINLNNAGGPEPSSKPATSQEPPDKTSPGEGDQFADFNARAKPSAGNGARPHGRECTAQWARIGKLRDTWGDDVIAQAQKDAGYDDLEKCTSVILDVIIDRVLDATKGKSLPKKTEPKSEQKPTEATKPKPEPVGAGKGGTLNF